MGGVMLEIRNLHKRLGGKHVLRGVNLVVNKGEERSAYCVGNGLGLYVGTCSPNSIYTG